MPTRRRALATGAALLGTGTTAGCLDLLLGGGLSFEATRATVSQSTLDETGYQENRIRDVGIEREFEAAGQTRQVSITNWHAEYDKEIDLQDLGLPVEGSQRAAIFGVLSTPRVEVAGQEFNPIDDVSTADIVSRLQSRYEGISGLQQVGESAATVLDASTTATEFRGDLELRNAGVTVDVTLHVTEAVEDGEDFVLAVGGYPNVLSGERENTFALFEGVEHDA